MSYPDLYDKRDIIELDRAGNYYCRHVEAMTREKLHMKSDIAAELGYRDLKIKEIESKLEIARDALYFYADSEEWSMSNNGHWKLLFNSSEYDGDGYFKAQEALERIK